MTPEPGGRWGEGNSPMVVQFNTRPSVREKNFAFERYKAKDFDPFDLAEIYHEASKIKPYMFESIAVSTSLFFRRPIDYITSIMFSGDPTRDRVMLPTDFPPLDAPVGAAMRTRRSGRTYSGEPITLAEISSLLYHSCGVTCRIDRGNDDVLYLRAHASGGGLYPVDAWVFALNVEGLDPGLYFYNAREHSLEVVKRKDDIRADTERLWIWGPEDQRVITKTYSALVALTGAFWRSRAKYGMRGYRLVLQESGHLGQNLYVNATGLGLACTANASFFDDDINEYLGVDGVDEAVLHTFVLGRPSATQPLVPEVLPPGALREGF